MLVWGGAALVSGATGFEVSDVGNGACPLVAGDTILGTEAAVCWISEQPVKAHRVNRHAIHRLIARPPWGEVR